MEIIMLCEKCGKNPATVMYTQIINGQKSAINICSQCAAQESIFDNFGSLLSFSPMHYQSVSCPVCGTSLSEFTRSGRAGCGECYNTFRKSAEAMLKKIHGTSQHCFSSPEAPVKKAPNREESKTDSLRRRLSAAIEAENFEEAAKLRDELRAMEKEDK